MINHILVPLDGSTLAECVLPHVATIAPVTHARITLLHVLQQTRNGSGTPAVDPVEWHLQKQNAEKYLEGIVTRLGADIGLECKGCGRRVMLTRRELAKRLKTNLTEHKTDEPSNS